MSRHSSKDIRYGSDDHRRRLGIQVCLDEDEGRGSPCIHQVRELTVNPLEKVTGSHGGGLHVRGCQFLFSGSLFHSLQRLFSFLHQIGIERLADSANMNNKFDGCWAWRKVDRCRRTISCKTMGVVSRGK